MTSDKAFLKNKLSFWKLLFLFILIQGIFVRFFLLDRIPIGITGDELDYVLNAKALFLTGSDISGLWNPISLTPPPFEMPKGEIPYFLLSPFVGPLPFSLLSARLLHALFSSLFMLGVFLLVRKSIGMPQAYAALLVLSLNPWSIWFGRTAYDTPLSVYFYYFAFLILLYAKRWSILLSAIPLSIAFFGYVGTKSILIPFAGISAFYSWYVVNNRRFGRYYILLLLFCTGILLYFFLSMHFSSRQNRASEILTPGNAKIITLVNAQRREAVQSKIVSVYSNKYWVYLNEAARTYAGAFSPVLHFISGEQTAFISLRDQGFFYPFEIVFVPFGVYFLFRRKRRQLYALGALLFIAPIPSALSSVGVSYAIRSSMMIPLIAILIGTGMVVVVSLGKSRMYRVFIASTIVLLYGIFYGNFLVNYFLRNPIYASETHNFSGRIVAKYMDLAQKSGKEIWLVENTSVIGKSSHFRNYLFYANAYNADSKNAIRNAYQKNLTIYNHIQLKSCIDLSQAESALVIVAPDFCKKLKTQSKKLSIARLSDGGEIYSILDPGICTKYTLHRYPESFRLKNFNIEGLSEKDFCENYITYLE